MNTAYKVLRTILTPIYKFYYNPKIIGKENIPKEGSIIIAGNHKHLMDQCNIIISTKRVITYMAKKEYFDNPLTKVFFKMVKCIPVDRSKKDENAKSKVPPKESKAVPKKFVDKVANVLKTIKSPETDEAVKNEALRSVIDHITYEKEANNLAIYFYL